MIPDAVDENGITFEFTQDSAHKRGKGHPAIPASVAGNGVCC